MTKTLGYTIFSTPIGACAVAWGARALTAVQLPEGSELAARARLYRRFPNASESKAPPPFVRDAIDGIRALLDGEQRDLSHVPIDEEGLSAFQRRVTGVARAIPPGQTMTYGEIAQRLGEPNAAREVGDAMGRNPFPIVVPCHRVLAAGGKLGGFSARGGAATKLRLLEIEGAEIGEPAPLFGDLPRALKPARR
ncbi:MAG TPA: methylated-DNA--[protein]-cysteine S-methyltransferase [Caulobacteraceae bacterium]|nr:methylated-DNA--[protein]-cysteine S-methyltransferase [Caulobacteraceae bacterium]